MSEPLKRAPLKEYAKNVTSQFGEDGILLEIFSRLGVQLGRCIEFGAWDGKHYSNTWNLWHNLNWEALLIEGDKSRFTVLEDSTAKRKNVTVLNAFVAEAGPNALEALIEEVGFGLNVDLLSIDIDGNDYHVFESLVRCAPRVVIIEYNPTIPPDIDFVQPIGHHLGASALAIFRLAQSKHYKVVCITDSNCILVHENEFSKLSVSEANVVNDFPRKYLSYLISGYEGDCYLTSPVTYKPTLPALTMGGFLSVKFSSIKSSRASNLEAMRAPGLIPVMLFRHDPGNE